MTLSSHLAHGRSCSGAQGYLFHPHFRPDRPTLPLPPSAEVSGLKDHRQHMHPKSPVAKGSKNMGCTGACAHVGTYVSVPTHGCTEKKNLKTSFPLVSPYPFLIELPRTCQMFI